MPPVTLPRTQPLGLDQLRERLAALEQPGATSTLTVPLGWAELDLALPGGGLSGKAVHEWIGLEDLAPRPSLVRRWSPAIGVLVHMARACAEASDGASEPLSIVWVGRKVWPSAQSLSRLLPQARSGNSSTLLARSLFIDAHDVHQRLWAADQATRCPGVLVIADGSGFDMPASRRLQLSAEAGRWMVHLARPPWEIKALSAASTRFRVGRACSDSKHVRWHVTMVRCKGLRSMGFMDRTFTIQRNACDRVVCASPEAGDRPGSAKIAG